MHPEEEKNLLLFCILYCFFAIKVYNISIKRTEDKTMTNKIRMAKRFYSQKAVKEFIEGTLKKNGIRRWDIFTEEDALGDTRYRIEYYI